MKRLFLAFAILGCSSSPTQASPDDAAADVSPETEASVDTGSETGPSEAEAKTFATLVADTETMLASTGTPGASIAIVLHGKLAFAAGVGKRNVKTGDPVTTATLFRAASMSKMIVAATAMTLVDEGKLDLSAPITKYVPWFELASGFDASTLTTELLLSHHASFPCDTIPQCGTTSSGARKDFFVANPQPLWAPPGSIYDYSNTGFTLAATVIEAAAGAAEGSYEQLAHDRVMAPSGMTTATFDAKAAKAADHATGYTLDDTGKVTQTIEPASLDCPLLHPPGGINATATDYAHFAELLLANGGSVLKPASVSVMSSPHADMHTFATQSYGLGLIHQFSPYPDHASVWHDGSLPGFLSMVWLVPDSGFAVVAMVNARGGKASADAIVGDALGLFIEEARKGQPSKTDASTWSGYVGTYDDDYGTLGKGVVVTLDTGTLSIDAPNAVDYGGGPSPVKGAMKQLAIDTWQLPDGTGVTFFPDGKGTFTYLASRRGVAIRK
ncbi:MAG: serine hydrolase domain-containing protein [Polyangiales bacterium]